MSDAAPVDAVAFLYRWRLKPGMEAHFVEAWTRRTESLLGRGSLGSRLHRGDDGMWYGYALWPSERARERAFATTIMAEGPSMDDAVVERMPEVRLETVVDRLVATSPAAGA